MDEVATLHFEMLYDCYPVAWNRSQYEYKGIKTSNRDSIKTECFHSFTTVEVRPASIIHLDMKIHTLSVIVNRALHIPSRQRRKIESHPVPGHGISLVGSSVLAWPSVIPEGPVLVGCQKIAVELATMVRMLSNEKHKAGGCATSQCDMISL